MVMTATNTKRRFLTATTIMTATSTIAEPDKDEFLEQLKSQNTQVQVKAWMQADQQEPSIIQELGDLLLSQKPNIAKAAHEAMKRIVHSVGKDPSDPKRKVVSEQLIQLLNKEAIDVRIITLRLLSLIADTEIVPKITPWIQHPQLREEVVFCLERIPNSAATEALIQCVEIVPDSFKPRIIAALGHRKDEKATDVMRKYLESSNSEIVMATIKAVSYIGKHPGVNPPALDVMSPRQKKIALDCALRFTDAQIAKGNIEMAMDILDSIFAERADTMEEHYICAGIITAAKIDNPDVITGIGKLLTHKHYIVRDTAKRALIDMDNTTVDTILRDAMNQTTGEINQVIQEIIQKREEKKK
jgi:HEAT repeat protein